ncbi:uncharacterized protein LOC111500016 isoform X5 [Cucurbita maxima]|uniref:Uncharacterized protein LOC111500016 isoform X5 n=1 Tax=Cucurbita maxima TaxID=3661 RepID=A0A6J1HMY5_CUCMA|nr:uncharacterized protein LOC111500016 isoform X5 [Cucurbita maxima]
MVGASHSPGGVAARSDRTATIKFLCSYGGRILPRYPDGKLRYLGGVTRVLAVDRSIPFSGYKRPSHWIKQNLKTQGATAAILPLDVHGTKISHCRNQRSTRSVCSVFCTKSFIRNHSPLVLGNLKGN